MSIAVGADRRVVGLLVRLRLSVLRNGLRGNRPRIVSMVIGAALAVSVGVLGALRMGSLRGDPHLVDLVATIFAALTLWWALMAVILFANDESADPTRLTMLPLRPLPMIVGSLAAACTGPGPLFVGLLAIGAAAGLATGPAGVLAACLAVPLTVATIITISRTIAAANARVLTSRRGRDLAIVVGLMAMMVLQGANLAAQSVLRDGSVADLTPAAFEPVGRVAQWLPPMSALAAVDDVSHGRWAVGALRTAAALGTLVLLMWLWYRGLHRLMTSGDLSTIGAARSVRHRGLRRLVPAGRVGVVMERQLVYLMREPRARAALFLTIGMAVMLCIFSTVTTGAGAWPLFVIGTMLGRGAVNTFGTDGSAFWTVLASTGTLADARREIGGRVLAVAAHGIPLMVVLGVGYGWATGAPATAWTGALLGIAELGAVCAVGMHLSVRRPYAMPADDSPLASAAPGQNALVLANSMGTMAGSIVLLLPAIVLSAMAALGWVGEPIALLVTAVTAVAAWFGSVEIGARGMQRRGPEILAAVIER